MRIANALLSGVALVLGLSASAYADEPGGGFFASIEGKASSIGVPDIVGAYTDANGRFFQSTNERLDAGGGSISIGHAFVDVPGWLGKKAEVKLSGSALTGTARARGATAYSSLAVLSVDGTNQGGPIGATTVLWKNRVEYDRYGIDLTASSHHGLVPGITLSPRLSLDTFQATTRIRGADFLPALSDNALLEHRLVSRGIGIRPGIGIEIEPFPWFSFGLKGYAGGIWRDIQLRGKDCRAVDVHSLDSACDATQQIHFASDSSRRLSPVVGAGASISFMSAEGWKLSAFFDFEADYGVPGYRMPTVVARRPMSLTYGTETSMGGTLILSGAF